MYYTSKKCMKIAKYSPFTWRHRRFEAQYVEHMDSVNIQEYEQMENNAELIGRNGKAP